MLKKRWILPLIVLSTVLQMDSLGYANKRALVIGNSDYRGVPLNNPFNDANDMAATLERLEFSVIKKLDATQQEMENAIREFGNQLQRGDIALFYFSGHGSQVNGINYLLPIGEDIRSEDEIKYKAVDAGMVLDKIEKSGSRVNIIILDACRNNPYKGFRSASRGLAMMSAPGGTLIAYATAPGTVAFDGEGENSPYTKHLLEVIQTPGLKIEEIFKKVRRAVMAETQSKQIPWESSSLTDDFYFTSQQPSQPSERPEQTSPQTDPLVSREFIDNMSASSILKSQKDSKSRAYTYGPHNAFDGDKNTAWVEGVPDHGINEWLNVTFTRTVLVTTVALVGEYKGQKNNRVKTLQISFSDGTSQTVSLADSPDVQTIQLAPPRTTDWVRFEILDIYPGTRFKDTPIAEVYFK